MLNNIIIAEVADLWEALAFLVFAVGSGIANHFISKAKEKREQEKFKETQATIATRPKPAAASTGDDTGWQRVSVVQEDLAAFLKNAKRNRQKLKQQSLKKSPVNYHQAQHEVHARQDEETPHLDIAPLPSHDEQSSMFHQNMVTDVPLPQPVPVPIPVPIPAPKPLKAAPPQPAQPQYVFQHDEQTVQDMDTGESTTHRIVANAVEPEFVDESVAAHKLAARLKNRNDFRQAFLLSEILARPLALRKESPASWDA